MIPNLETKLTSSCPKTILACDGGGILGLMTVEILAKLEADLREKLGKPQLVLADWFDFVCGTSTGAIIATCISAGMSMDRIRAFYVESGEQMFDKASVFKRLRYSYNDEPLAAKLRAELNRALGYPKDAPPATLGDAGLRTLLMMVLRNHSTDSPWPIWNNPEAKYNQRNRKDCNLNLPLWQAKRVLIGNKPLTCSWKSTNGDCTSRRKTGNIWKFCVRRPASMQAEMQPAIRIYTSC